MKTACTRTSRGGGARTAALLVLLTAGCTTGPGPERAAFSVHVESVAIDPRTSSHVVLLQENEGARRRLPIWIGPFEAQSIALAMEHVEVPRPNTHDLIKNLIDGVRAQIERVVITELRDNTYYAVIEVALDGRRVSVDSRPSDAIAVAIRTGAPVFATGEVLGRSEEPGEEGEALDIDWSPPRERSDSPQVQSH
jgi:bifunctional DNase/RNase